MAVNRIFGAIAQSGGATGALDRISSTALADKDMAVVTDDTLGSINFYTYDGASVLTESLPTVITPDDIGGGAGRWVLISPYYFVENLVIQAGSNILTNELYGNGADLDIGYQNGTVNTLRLWKATATEEFKLDEFNAGAYAESVAAKNRADQLSEAN